MVVRCHELGEVKFFYIEYNSSHFFIYLPNIIKIDRKLTTFRQKELCTVFLRHGVYYILLVKDLPKVPGVAARMGFQPTTFRSKGIESTNVPPCPTNINR